MVIIKGVPFLLPSGKKVGTVQLASKNRLLFFSKKKNNF